MWVQSECLGCVPCLPSSCPLVQRWAGLSGIQDLPDAGGGPLMVRSLPFGRFTALPLVHCLQMWLYFAFLGGF